MWIRVYFRSNFFFLNFQICIYNLGNGFGNALFLVKWNVHNRKKVLGFYTNKSTTSNEY